MVSSSKPALSNRRNLEKVWEREEHTDYHGVRHTVSGSNMSATPDEEKIMARSARMQRQMKAMASMRSC
eukprot:scaffold53011_cov36-Tisochrysis_lutea.AAC.2